MLAMEELELLKKMAYVSAIGFTIVLQASPIIQPVLIFFVYVNPTLTLCQSSERYGSLFL